MQSDNNTFLLFWLWEYTRRALENKTEFESLLAARENGPEKQLIQYVDGVGKPWASSTMVSWSWHSFKGWGTVPANSDIYTDANAIIEAIISDELCYKSPDPDIDWPGLKKLEDKEGRSVLRYNANHFEETEISKHLDPVIDFITGKGKGQPGTFFFIDTTRPLEELIKRLEYEYSCCKSPGDDRGRDKLKQDLVDQWARGRTDGKQIRPKSLISRALGLWLWDYIEKTSCTQKTAFKAIADNYESKILTEVDHFDTDNLKRYLSRTQKAISSSTFLSMSKG